MAWPRMVPLSGPRFHAHDPICGHCSRPHAMEPGCPPACPPTSATHAGVKAIVVKAGTPLITIPKMENGTQTPDSIIRTEFPTLGLVSQTYRMARQAEKRTVAISATFGDSPGPARGLGNCSPPGSTSLLWSPGQVHEAETKSSSQGCRNRSTHELTD